MEQAEAPNAPATLESNTKLFLKQQTDKLCKRFLINTFVRPALGLGVGFLGGEVAAYLMHATQGQFPYGIAIGVGTGISQSIIGSLHTYDDIKQLSKGEPLEKPKVKK